MRQTRIRFTAIAIAAASFLLGASAAEAAHRHAGHARAHHAVRTASIRSGYGGHVIQCVAFAKTASDVVLHGNAADWWYNARGVYARGAAPEAGSVLSFRATRGMPLGHVAVVTAVEDSRTIVIDQSHWAQRGISRNVHVMDVSPANDWSAVRVALNGREGTYGSIYPTHGFIYARPDGDATPALVLASARATTRGAVRIGASHGAVDLSALRHPMASTEVAEAPDDAFADDAPNRNIR